jgi:hypothetical protein
MSAILNVLIGIGGGISALNISFSAANSANGSYYYYGWSSYSNGAVGARQYIPGTQPGSVTGTPTFNGALVKGVYSNSTSTNLIATRYCILLEDSYSIGFVSSLTINGTLIASNPTGIYDDGTCTAFYYDVGVSSTLITASSTAVVT